MAPPVDPKRISNLISKPLTSDSSSSTTPAATLDLSGGQSVSIEMHKGTVGLGFCIEGGRDSPRGDTPITVKRLFKGKMCLVWRQARVQF